MTATPSSPPPEPLGYQSAAPAKRRPIVDLGLGITCGFAACLLSVMLLFVVPFVWAPQERMMQDFGVRVPGATRSLIAFSSFCRSGGVILIWVLFAIPPFVSSRTQPWPPTNTSRRIFGPSRLLITVLFALFCIWIVVGLMLPHTTLLDAVGTGQKRQPTP